MTLVDTSVWVDVFRNNNPLDLEALADFDELVTCLPVIQEALQGLDNERAFRLARDAFMAMPTVDSPADASLYLHAADLYRQARRGGAAVRSSVDCLIAASAIRHDLELLHHDRDFTALATVSALRQRNIGNLP